MSNTVPTGVKIKLNKVRLSFPQLHKPDVPKGYDDSEPKFSANFLLDPQNPEHRQYIKQCQAEIKRLISEAWGEAPPKMKPVECFGKGENFVSKQTKKPYSGYEGLWAIAANNKKRPLCLGKNKENLSPDEVEQVLYAGCYVDVIFNFWVQDNKHGEAIRCSLQGVKFRCDGEAFASGGASADDFDDDIEDGDLAGEFDDDDL